MVRKTEKARGDVMLSDIMKAGISKEDAGDKVSGYVELGGQPQIVMRESKEDDIK